MIYLFHARYTYLTGEETERLKELSLKRDLAGSTGQTLNLMPTKRIIIRGGRRARLTKHLQLLSACLGFLPQP